MENEPDEETREKITKTVIDTEKAELRRIELAITEAWHEAKKQDIELLNNEKKRIKKAARKETAGDWLEDAVNVLLLGRHKLRERKEKI